MFGYLLRVTKPWRTLHCTTPEVAFWRSKRFVTTKRSTVGAKDSPEPDYKEGTDVEIATKPIDQASVLTTSEKVKQAGKDTFYTIFVIAGIGLTGLMGYAIFRELFSSKSASGVYSDALKICKKDVRIKAILGEPIKAYGELGSLRGRRRHVRSVEFDDGSSRIVQVKFYLSGPYNNATVYVEKDVSENSFRTLIFEADDLSERFSVLPAKPVN